jgi:hypothetical protein
MREADGQRLSPELALKLPAEILDAPLKGELSERHLDDELPGAHDAQGELIGLEDRLPGGRREGFGPESAQRAAWVSSTKLNGT